MFGNNNSSPLNNYMQSAYGINMPQVNPYMPTQQQGYQNPYQQQMNQYQQQQYPQQQPQPQQQQSIFLQPNGSLFSIDNVDQISNVPVTEGSISCIIFPNANMMYLKSMQQGKPVLLTYSLSNAEAVKTTNPQDIIKENKEEVKPAKSDEFESKINQQIGLLGDTSQKLWNEVDFLKNKLAEIYKQLGVEQ